MGEISFIDKIKKVFFLSIGLFGFEFLLNKFLGNNQYNYVFGMIVGLFSVLAFYMKKNLKANNFQVISFFLIVCNFAGYIFFTMLNPTLKMSSMFTDLNFTTSQVNNFLTISLLTYGISQLFGGYVLSRFKIAGYSTMIFFGALFITSQGLGCLCSSSILSARALTGMFLSVSGVVISYYPVTYWKKENLTFLVNAIIFVSIKVASLANIIVTNKIIQNKFLWKEILTYLGYTMIIFSIITFVFFKFFGKVSQNISENKNEKKSEDSIISEFFHLIKTDKRIITSCILSFACVVYFYFFRNTGCLIDIFKGFFPQENQLMGNNLLNNISAYVALAASIISSFVSFEIIILFCLLFHFTTASLFMYLGTTSVLITNLMIAGSALGWACHNIPSLILGKDLGDKKSAGLIFSLLNISAMLIGSFILPKLGMYFFDQNVLAKISVEQSVFLAINKLFIFSLIALLSGMYLYKIKKK